MKYKIHSIKYPGIQPEEVKERLYLYYWDICFNNIIPEKRIIIKDFYYNNEKHCLNAPAHRSSDKDQIICVYVYKGYITNLSGPAKILFNRQNYKISKQYFINGEHFVEEEKWKYKIEQKNASLWKNIII